MESSDQWNGAPPVNEFALWGGARKAVVACDHRMALRAVGRGLRGGRHGGGGASAVLRRLRVTDGVLGRVLAVCARGRRLSDLGATGTVWQMSGERRAVAVVLFGWASVHRRGGGRDRGGRVGWATAAAVRGGGGDNGGRLASSAPGSGRGVGGRGCGADRSGRAAGRRLA